MSKITPISLQEICTRDERFPPEAYLFLNDALDYLIKKIVEDEGSPRHVNGAELMHGFRDYTLQEFGPMSRALLKEWGITKTRHVGEMVFNLIEAQIFNKEEGDTPADFDNIYNFKDAFDTPYLPNSQQLT